MSLDAGTVAILREHRTRQVAERLKAGSKWTDTGHVFVRADGGLMSPDTPSQLMPKLVAQAGVPSAPLHDLRHVHATTLLLALVPPHVVAARLGHRDATVTLRTYAHVLRLDAAEVGEVFANAVSSC